jgi:hypothetical protein
VNYKQNKLYLACIVLMYQNTGTEKGSCNWETVAIVVCFSCRQVFTATDFANMLPSVGTSRIRALVQMN